MSSRRIRKTSRGRVGLALAGGGPIGAMYEIGALRALEEAVEGLEVNDAWSYVGVSAGSFIAACLANGLTVRQMLASVLRGEQGQYPLKPELFFTPAYAELARRGLKLPRLALEALVMFGRYPNGRAVGEAISLLTQALPVGLFNNEPIEEYLADLFATEGRTDDFRKLRRPLTVVAADLERGTSIRFGATGIDDVPISLAVRASTAVPGVYPPVAIKGRQCVDGVLLKTVHASVALEQGAELLLCINPIVPVDVSAATETGRVPEGVLSAMGLPAVLSQTFRTLIHSRLEIGLSRYASRFPDADIILLEPQPDEYTMFFANVFSFRSRVAICEEGYASTRRDLLTRFDEIAPVMQWHGLTLRRDVLEDDERDLWLGAGLEAQPPARARTPLDVTSGLARALSRLEREAEAGARTTARRKRPRAAGAPAP